MTLSDTSNMEKYELKPTAESKVYFQAHMDARRQMGETLGPGAKIMALPFKSVAPFIWSKLIIGVQVQMRKLPKLFDLNILYVRWLFIFS